MHIIDVRISVPSNHDLDRQARLDKGYDSDNDKCIDVSDSESVTSDIPDNVEIYSDLPRELTPAISKLLSSAAISDFEDIPLQPAPLAVSEDGSDDVEVHEDVEIVNENEDTSEEVVATPPRVHHYTATEQAQKVVRRVVTRARERAREFRLLAFQALPDWLKDNDYLWHHHRPPMPSFLSCFRSIFKIHTETGNIWTHLIGCVGFVIMTLYFLIDHHATYQWQEQLVFFAFFTGAILCMSFSWIFHTVYCHSFKVSKLFSKLDYSGIALLIIGSFIPWLYYGFYCQEAAKIVYLVAICVLGCGCIVVSLWDRFGTPRFRPVRAGMFVALGCSGLVPAVHYLIKDGFYMAYTAGSLGWLLLMGGLYILGAVMYAVRIPERWFPGKCDIWFHSHQIFHVLVVAGALVHYKGIFNMASYRKEWLGQCMPDDYIPSLAE